MNRAKKAGPPSVFEQTSLNMVPSWSCRRGGGRMKCLILGKCVPRRSHVGEEDQDRERDDCQGGIAGPRLTCRPVFVCGDEEHA